MQCRLKTLVMAAALALAWGAASCASRGAHDADGPVGVPVGVAADVTVAADAASAVDAGLAVAAAPKSPEGVRGADYFPNFELTNDKGEKRHFFTDLIAGKVVLVNFIYTSCGDSCPLETARLRKTYDALQGRVGKDVHFVSISIDPENDTPAALAAYKERFRIGEGWSFWVGHKGDAEEIQKKLGVYREGGNQKKDHTLDMMIGNQATGQWIKRSHLENSEVLINLLNRLQQRQPEQVAFKGYEQAPSRIGQDDGVERLYVSRCLDCHSIGRGDGIGPDLLGVTQRRDRTWLRRWIKEPDAMLHENDPTATALFARYMQVAMPNLKLEDADVDLLIDFIARESAEHIRLHPDQGH